MSNFESDLKRKETQDRSALFSILTGEWMEISPQHKVNDLKLIKHLCYYLKYLQTRTFINIDRSIYYHYCRGEVQAL